MARKVVSVILLAFLVCAGPASAKGPVIVAFGDSLMAGYGLAPDVGFVPQLQDWLDDRGVAAEIVNASVSGDTTSGGLARLDWALGGEIDGVIVELGANDFLRGLDPALARDNLEAIVSGISGRDLPVLLVRLPAPPNYGPAYKEAFDAIYPELAERYNTLYYPDFFGVLRGEVENVGVVMQPDGLHPSAEGVARIVEDIGPFVAELIDRAGSSS